MKHKDIKKQLRTEASHFVPDNKAQIIKKLSISSSIKTNNKSFGFSKPFSLAFSIFIIVIITIAVALTNLRTENTFLVIEINPAFELELNKQDEIIAIRGLNLDGVLVLESLEEKNWSELSSTEVINNLIDLSIDLGYLDIDNNRINVTAINPKLSKETKVANAYRTKLTNATVAKQFDIMIINKNDNGVIQVNAKQNKVSVGKMYLIDRAREIDYTLSIMEAKEMTPKQLNDIINQNNNSNNKDFKNYYNRQIKTFRDYQKNIIQSLKDYQDNYEVLITVIEGLIDNVLIPNSEIESQINNIIDYLHIDNYHFNPETEVDKHAYYLEVVTEIQTYAKDYFKELANYIDTELKTRKANLKREIKDRLKENPNDYAYEYHFTEDLEDFINKKAQHKGHGKKGRMN